MSSTVRLYVEQELGQGQTVTLSREQAHYLFGVMRLAVGARVALFNGRDGEFAARVEEAGKRGGVLVCEAQSRPLQMPPDLWLLFAPIKKARTDFIVEKAAEMGAARICPVQTEFTNSERIRQDRLQAHAVEAAEQCGGTYVPEVAELQKLDRVLDGWPDGRRLMFCDEATVEEVAAGGAMADPAMGDSAQAHGVTQDRTPAHGVTAAGARLPVLADGRAGPWAILIGPEGGFSTRERARLATMAAARRVSLGPRILRADTAAVAALTLWQMQLGDWT